MTRKDREKRDLEICKLAKSCYLDEISKKTGETLSFIKYVLYKYGVKYRKKPNSLQSEKAKQILSLEGKMKEIEIARQVDCSRQYVNQVLKQKNKQELL